MELLDDTHLDQRVAARIKQLRASHGLTLDQLAERSGVSRAMISRVERGEASATAVLLARLANALGITLSTLFSEDMARGPINRSEGRPVWTDPATGYTRADVAPAGAPIDVVDVMLPTGARVAYDNCVPLPVEQIVWVLDGSILLTANGQIHSLNKGDSALVRLDRPTAFENPGMSPARYAVILATWQTGRKTT